MKKMRGIIDPYTLGFIIALLGSSTAYLVQTNDNKRTEQTESVVMDTGSNDTDSNFEMD